MKKSLKDGFTLIELLVVIAIIGILAGILFVAIDPSSKITDANTASVEASLSGVPTAATVFYTTADRYSFDNGTVNLCADASMSGIAAGLADFVCNDAAQAWAVQGRATAGSGDYYCIDSTGAGISTSSTALALLTACPA